MDWNQISGNVGEPDFNNLLAVLRHEVPSRPTLFEFFLNDPLYDRIADPELKNPHTDLEKARQVISAFRNAGYDYAEMSLPGFNFPTKDFIKKSTISLNQGALIHDRESFAAYPWPDPEKTNFKFLDELVPLMPQGMKLLVPSPNGVLENATAIVGYEDLCYLILDQEKLAYDVFEAIGSRIVRFFEIASAHPLVGAGIANDDWGFKTQTQFSPRDMRKFVFPWYKKIVEIVHAAGKPVILHSCGHFQRIITDIIDDMQFDGRHSYEDIIMPAEEVYEKYHERLAILGGIDMDFICRSSPQEVYRRSKAMLERSATRGSFALGTGNSVPEYVPQENYFAMIWAALEYRQ